MKGTLLLGRLKDGRSKCAMFEGGWLSPCAFERKAGRSASKDWKKSMSCNRRPLKEELERRNGQGQEGRDE